MDKRAVRRPAADAVSPSGPAIAEERLVADDRAGLSPSEMVERKLRTLLKEGPLPVSQISVGRRLIRSR
jgi:hypothetical protein